MSAWTRNDTDSDSDPRLRPQPEMNRLKMGGAQNSKPAPLRVVRRVPGGQLCSSQDPEQPAVFGRHRDADRQK
jgi:hypothetical protein